MSASPPPRSRWTNFVRRYGWRAYAIPLLTLVTVVALFPGMPLSTHGTPAPRTTAPATRRPATQIEGLSQQTRGFRAAASAPKPRPVTVDLGSDSGTSCTSNGYAQLIVVSISRQHLWACAGSKQVNSTAVTTGKVVDNDQTPLGSWRVQGKQRDRYLVGPGYRDYVHFWVPFNGDFGLHDAPWQTMPYGSKDWRTKGSHGCVHVPHTTMSWIYQWARVNETVVTIES